MDKRRRFLLVLLFFCSTPLLAQLEIEIEIIGLEKALADNALLLMSIQQQKDQPQLTEARMRRLHKKAGQEISLALQPFGYYHAVIETSLSAAESAGWLLSYRVDPGPPLLVSQFDFTLSGEMHADEKFQALIKTPPLQPGDIFNHVVYEDFKARLAKLAADRGYFNAQFVEHRVEINLDKDEAAIRLDYAGGARYYFGEVSMQQDIIVDELLQRYVPFERGDPYSLNQLLELQHALNDSDYFDSVEVSPGEPDADSREIPIEVKLTARKPHRFSVGLGFGTDTGGRAKFSWEMPRVNDQGHRLDISTEVSEIGYSALAHYRIPVLNPRTDQLIFSGGIVNENTDSSESTLRTVGVSLKQSRGEWREVLSLNYQDELFEVAGDSGDSILLLPGASWSRIWGNNFINVLDGLRFDLEMRGASDELISDTTFFQLQSNIKFITGLGWRNRLISRGTLGRIWTGDFEQLPSSVRFFAGGAQSVRGYAYESLGPVDENGEVTGGKYLLVGSIELEHSFHNKWGAAIFYDVGNAINDTSDELERGAGFGLRWRSPVGPVRIDLAKPLSRPDETWRLHITIGPDL